MKTKTTDRQTDTHINIHEYTLCRHCNVQLVTYESTQAEMLLKKFTLIATMTQIYIDFCVWYYIFDCGLSYDFGIIYIFFGKAAHVPYRIQ